MGLNIPDDSVGCGDWAHPPLFFFCIATDGIRERGAFVVSASPMSPFLHRTGNCLRKQNLHPKWPLSLNHRHCMKICTPNSGMGKGSCQQYLCFYFNSRHTSKDGAWQNSAKSQRTSQQFHFFSLIVAFCVLVIKNNNGVLSPPLAGSQPGTIRGRLIGRTGWGICWRRHGP